MTDQNTAPPLVTQLGKVLTAQPGDIPRPLSTRTRLSYNLRIRRIEFLPLTLTVPLVPALLAAKSWRELVCGDALVAALMIVLSVQIGNIANCLADREMDATYKTRLSEAVYGLGVPNVVRQIVLTSALCVLLAIFLTFRTQHVDLLVIGLLWAVLGIGYSLPPLHLNGRGIWQLPTLLSVYFILPGLFMLRAFDGPIEWAGVVALCGFSLTSVGIIVVNHAEDLPEDERFSIRTYVRALGLTNALFLGTGMLVIGAILFVGSAYSMSGLSWGFLLYFAAWAPGLRFIWQTALAVRGKPIDLAVATLRARSKRAPLHTCLIGWATVALAAFVFLVR
jgi:1,4-dihydroxy-2-naphthoate octaprenyltransferase